MHRLLTQGNCDIRNISWLNLPFHTFLPLHILYFINIGSYELPWAQRCSSLLLNMSVFFVPANQSPCLYSQAPQSLNPRKWGQEVRETCFFVCQSSYPSFLYDADHFPMDNWHQRCLHSERNPLNPMYFSVLLRYDLKRVLTLRIQPKRPKSLQGSTTA